MYKLTFNANECDIPQVACTADVNLLTNPGFEVPTVETGDHWDLFTTGTSWLAEWVGAAVEGRPTAGLELQENGIMGGAWSSTGAGSQWTELDADWGGPANSTPAPEPSSVQISQTIPTIVGKTYHVSFDFSPRPDTDATQNSVLATWNGVTGTTFSAPSTMSNTEWTSHSYDFVATTTSTKIAFADAGVSDSLGSFLDNASVTCVPEAPKATVTLCKYDTSEHALPNWTLMLKGDHVEDVVVPSNVSAGTTTTAVLTAGQSYIAVASGTWTNQDGANPVDAEYSTTDGWATQMDGYTGYSTNILELQANQAFDPNSTWGPYNANHQYAQSFIPGSSAAANFRIFDGNGTTPEEGWYPDNSGSLDVSLYEGYAGITGENGCVTFADVPYGTYSVDEILKQNWTNQSGLTTLVVDSPTETHNVVNQDNTLPPPPTTATLSAVKIECDAEEYLPNWGNHGTSTINESTATAFLAEGDNAEHCRLVPWTFEWSLDGVGNPGDETPVGGAGWNPFTSTTIAANTASIPAGVKVWVREQFDIDYIGFTGQNTDQDVSAELYCNDDVLNYDNWEWINNTVAGHTYHCVAFNAPIDEVDHECDLETEHWDVEEHMCVPNDDGDDNNGGGGDSTPPPEARTLGGGIIGGGGGGSILGASTGQILGASCNIKYLDKYLRMGKKNDPEQVKKLQLFLNKWENAGLPVTGFFGPLTYAAVMAFQQHYFEEVLKPWGVAAPTGIVYQTTQRWINLMECPDLNLTIPPLEEWKEGAEL